jgi:hypothetical protein
MIKISKPGNLYHPYGPRHHGRRQRFTPPPLPFMPNPEFIEQIQAQIPQWLPNRESTAHFRAHMQNHIDTLKTNSQTHMQNSKQYLESVGQYLQQALSPFGIDCDYHVDGQTPPTPTPTPNDQQEEVPPTTDSTITPEPSAVPKTSELNTQQQNGISSWLNMFRTSGTNSSTTEATASSEITNPLQKQVEDCVEKIKELGFDDINEDILELVCSKKGDLNSVLDEIHSRYH